MPNPLPALVAPLLAAGLDPRRTRIPKCRPKDLDRIRSLLALPTESFYPVAPPINRNAFLACTASLLFHEEIEHLLVGLGAKTGRATKIHQLAHVIGDRRSVHIPKDVDAELFRHCGGALAAEAVMVHNHPHDRMLKLIGFEFGPTSSLRDRMTLLSYLSHPTVGLKALAGKGSVRCYVTKAGEVQEFRLPEITPFFGFLARLSQESMS